MIQELADTVRNDPQNIQGAISFLDALSYARRGGENWELSWMATVIKPGLATEAGDVASRLKNLNSWSTAIKFYEQALRMPLTKEELHRLGMMCQVFLSDETLRVMFAVQVREQMAECLLKLRRNDEAQKWMVEAADIRDKNKLGRNALFAGQVQGASGQRVIEGRIKKEEKKSETDPNYWRERAYYYRGRHEVSQEEDALKKGLALTSPQPEPERVLKGQADLRSWLLADYALFLKRTKREAEAVVLLRNELAQTPANSQSSEKAAKLLAMDFEKHVRVDDEVLWVWLSSRPQWDYTEERLLWRMLEDAKQEDRDKYFLRAEELTKEKDASCSHTLGWIMNRMHSPERSIPLLQYAFENAQGQELKEQAVFTLFESYLDTSDWQRAEQIFPQASKRLTPQEVSDWYSRIAVAAAKSGAKVDAMRIWKEVMNINANELGHLIDLKKAGLRKELMDFYREMQKKMPSSNIPARALEILNKE